MPRLTVLDERFAIRSVLGGLGPFEATYLAWDLENEQQVIIREFLPVKLVKRGEDGLELVPKVEEVARLYQYGLDRVIKEAKLFAKVDHPNVVREHEYFTENGTVYRVSDYHPGASLAYILQQQGGKVTPRTAVTIMMPLLEGIQAGHEQGLVHGSISPENIYLTKTGRPMLLSFRTTQLLLAQRISNLEAFQQAGFSPPEQYTPRGKHGPWSDVYGAGATLYTMLSGKILPDVPARLREDVAHTLIDQTFELSAGTREALKAALDMNITRRPQTIETFRMMLVEGFDLADTFHAVAETPAPKESLRSNKKVAESRKPIIDPETSPTNDLPLAGGDGPMSGGDGPITGGDGPMSGDAIPDRFTKDDSGFEDPIEKAVADSAFFEPPVTKQPLSFETLDYNAPANGGSKPFADDHITPPRFDRMHERAFPKKSVTSQSIAESYGAPIADYSPVSPLVERKKTTPAFEDDYEPATQTEPFAMPDNGDGGKGNGKMIMVYLVIGATLFAMSWFVVQRFQDRETVTFETGKSEYMARLVRGDSLFNLGLDILHAENKEAAQVLFEDAEENYRAALALSDAQNGDKRKLRRKIDSVIVYLNAYSAEELDEKEELAYIFRGDSLMRAAESYYLAGDSVEARSRVMQARQEYRKVLQVQPDDSLANARLFQSNQSLNVPVREERVLTTRANPEEARRQSMYMQFKMRGDSAFDVNNLQLAREAFQEALLYKPNDVHSTRRITQIDERLGQEQREGQYRRFMRSGNRLRDAGRLEEAKREFERALEFRPNDEIAESAIFALTSIIDRQKNDEATYITHTSRGEALLEKDDYQNALASFKQALLAKPDDEYASLKVQEIEETLNALARQDREVPEGMIDDNGIYNFTEEPPELLGGREVLQSRLRYPPKASEAGLEGRVSVRMIVDETGAMLNPEILKGIRHDMDAEVLRVIKGARFKPGTVGGQPVKSWYTLFFEFKLDR